MDDDPAEEKNYPVAPAKLSRTPSWIMLGFILGALFVWMLPRDAEPAAPPALAKRPAPPEPKRTVWTTLTTIEAVFEAWGQYAVWDNETTEVALWSAATKSFSECYEAKRSGGALYFRSIPKLTRRVIHHGKPPPDDCPLQFTETEQQYRDWSEYGRRERSVSGNEPEAIPEVRTAIQFKYLNPKPPPVPQVAPPSPPPVEKPPVEVPPK